MQHQPVTATWGALRPPHNQSLHGEHPTPGPKDRQTPPEHRRTRPESRHEQLRRKKHRPETNRGILTRLRQNLRQCPSVWG